MKRKWKTWQKVTLGATLGLIGIICCGAGLTAALSPSKPKGAPVATITDTGERVAAATQSAAPKPATLAKADVHLTVKTKTKDCFGSAGCNVEYTITAAWSPDTVECDVTYEVHGLQDTQTGTLNLHADGTYEQDSYQFGQTSSSSRKLTAKVVDIDCSIR